MSTSNNASQRTALRTAAEGGRYHAAARLTTGMRMKTIGLLGGIGPLATMDIERRLHRVAQQRIPPHFNSGYPPLVVWYCRHAPILVDETGQAIKPITPDPRLLDVAAKLVPLCDFLIPRQQRRRPAARPDHACRRPARRQHHRGDARRGPPPRLATRRRADGAIYCNPLVAEALG
jgi:hypothetical protein